MGGDRHRGHDFVRCPAQVSCALHCYIIIVCPIWYNIIVRVCEL